MHDFKYKSRIDFPGQSIENRLKGGIFEVVIGGCHNLLKTTFDAVYITCGFQPLKLALLLISKSYMLFLM